MTKKNHQESASRRGFITRINEKDPIWKAFIASLWVILILVISLAALTVVYHETYENLVERYNELIDEINEQRAELNEITFELAVKQEREQALVGQYKIIKSEYDSIKIDLRECREELNRIRQEE